MARIADSLASMGTQQLLLALVFLASYALALGRLAGARGRLAAAAGALLAAIGFVASGRSWEAGIIVLALAPLGLGLFAAAAWAFWVMATWPNHRVVVADPALAAPVSLRVPTKLLLRVWARLHMA
jgi:hypothetical protein